MFIELRQILASRNLGSWKLLSHGSCKDGSFEKERRKEALRKLSHALICSGNVDKRRWPSAVFGHETYRKTPTFMAFDGPRRPRRPPGCARSSGWTAWWSSRGPRTSAGRPAWPPASRRAAARRRCLACRIALAREGRPTSLYFEVELI